MLPPVVVVEVSQAKIGLCGGGLCCLSSAGVKRGWDWLVGQGRAGKCSSLLKAICGISDDEDCDAWLGCPFDRLYCGLTTCVLCFEGSP